MCESPAKVARIRMEEDAKSANPAAYVDEYNVHQLLKVRSRSEISSRLLSSVVTFAFLSQII